MRKTVLIVLLFPICLNMVAQSNHVRIDPSDSERDIIRKAAHVVPSERQLKWQQKELIAFFHFGMNTFTDREWGDGKENPQLFNPSAFDASQWVSLAKAAGIKQVILTAKHHDGFCLWPSKFTEHSVKNSLWRNGKGDVVRALSDACKVQHMGFGIYVSPWDRNSPLYGTDGYNDYFSNQLTELLSQYGTIAEVWFDGANGEGPNGKKQVYDFDRWYKIIRKFQPSAVIAIMGPDVRWVGTETGYGRETEWSVIPIDNLNPLVSAGSAQQDIAFSPKGDMRDNDLGSLQKIKQARGLAWYPAEIDVSIRPGWFYHESENERVNTPDKLMDIYLNSVGKNGLLLLNIPPDKRGLINSADSSALMQWKVQRDATFKNNLAKNAHVSCMNGIHKNALTDDDISTAFTTMAEDTSASIEIELTQPEKVNVLRLQEYIKRGQRVSHFTLEAWVNNGWNSIAAGTTVGHMRLINFDDVVSGNFRLRIQSSRLNPVLADMGLFYMSRGQKP